MFAIDCHVHGCRVLVDWSRVEAVHDGPEGPVLDWQCWCGARGRLVAGRSEPREVELFVVDDIPRSSSTAASPDQVAS
jgi:hypothetical protein